jgi:acyl-coenzyme A synthetase/AMP-(fatty) acid ligase
MNMLERTPLAELAVRFGCNGDRIVARAADGTVSRKEFLRQMQAWYQTFASTAGDRFALHLDDSVAFAAALFGAWHAGKTVYLPADALPSTMQSLGSHVDGFAGDYPGALQAATDMASSANSWQPLDPEAAGLVLYTSGSSGDPVAISKSLRQFDTEIAALESRFGERIGQAIVHGTVSHQHIYGLLFRVLWPLTTGRTMVSSRLGYPEQIAAAIAGEPTVLIASPAMLKRIPDSLDWLPLHSSLRAVFSSGGPMPADAADTIRKLWQQSAIEVFGSTETGGIASRENSSEPWQVLPGVEIRIVQGLLQIRSLHLPQLDWYETQDRARAAGEGFELLGRADRLVKLEERRISLSAIERALQAESWIDESRVLMLPGARSRIAAVAVLSDSGKHLLHLDGRKGLVDKLRNALRGQVDAIAIPRQWRFVDAMPINSEGKTTELSLASLFQSLRPTPRWLERDVEKASLKFTADDDLAVFEGHFPLSPILPGIALVDWVIRWGRDAFAIENAFLRMDAMKFQRMVAPGTELDLSMNWHADNGVMNFRVESVQGPHASGRIVFAAPAGLS